METSRKLPWQWSFLSRLRSWLLPRPDVLHATAVAQQHRNNFFRCGVVWRGAYCGGNHFGAKATFDAATQSVGSVSRGPKNWASGYSFLKADQDRDFIQASAMCISLRVREVAWGQGGFFFVLVHFSRTSYAYASPGSV